MTAPQEQSETDLSAAGDVVAGRYRLVRIIGSGGMGTVWEATNTWTERRVAIKFMGVGSHPSGRSTMPAEHADRFLREAKATARVRHPHVVDVLDMGNDPDRGGLFIVYDFLDGESLRGMLERRGKLSPDEALAVLVPAMEGVAEAHRCGVVHRDLKPENIFLARESGERIVPRVIDFGIAKITADEASDASLTKTGTALGTAHYMSPEQCRGAADIDARADVWALGVIWFEALTGSVPYEGDGYNQVIAAVLTTDAPALRAVRPDVSEQLARAVDRALVRDRDARHATVASFLDAIRGVEGPLATPIATPIEAPSLAPLASSRFVRPAVAGVALVLLAIALSRAVPSRREPTPVPPVTLVRPEPTVPDPARSPLAPARSNAPLDAGSGAPRTLTLTPSHRAPPLRRGPAVAERRPTIAAPTPLVARAPPTPRAPNGAPVLEP